MMEAYAFNQLLLSAILQRRPSQTIHLKASHSSTTTSITSETLIGFYRVSESCN